MTGLNLQCSLFLFFFLFSCLSSNRKDEKFEIGAAAQQQMVFEELMLLWLLWGHTGASPQRSPCNVE